MQENGPICYQRITANMINQFGERNVTLVGKIIGSQKDYVEFLVDGVIVKVLNIDEVPSSDSDILLEIRGYLTKDSKFFEAKAFTEIDQGFNFESYKKVITLIQEQYRELFYD